MSKTLDSNPSSRDRVSACWQVSPAGGELRWVPGTRGIESLYPVLAHWTVASSPPKQWFSHCGHQDVSTTQDTETGAGTRTQAPCLKPAPLPPASSLLCLLFIQDELTSQHLASRDIGVSPEHPGNGRCLRYDPGVRRAQAPMKRVWLAWVAQPECPGWT